MNVCYFTFAKSLYLQRTSSLQYPNEIAWAPYHVPWEIQAQTRACRNYMHTLSLSRFSLSKAPQGVMFLVVDMCSELPLSTSLLKDCWHSGLCGRSTKRSCPAFREDRRQWLTNTLTDGLKNHPFASRGDQLRGGIHAPELIKGSDRSSLSNVIHKFFHSKKLEGRSWTYANQAWSKLVECVCRVGMWTTLSDS